MISIKNVRHVHARLYVYTHTTVLKKQKNRHQNVNSAIMGNVYFFFLCGCLSLPEVIHINIFITEKNQLPFRKFCHARVISNVL